MQRAWNAALNLMAQGLKDFADSINLKGLFRDWANILEDRNWALYNEQARQFALSVAPEGRLRLVRSQAKRVHAAVVRDFGTDSGETEFHLQTFGSRAKLMPFMVEEIRKRMPGYTPGSRNYIYSIADLNRAIAAMDADLAAYRRAAEVGDSYDRQMRAEGKVGVGGSAISPLPSLSGMGPQGPLRDRLAAEKKARKARIAALERQKDRLEADLEAARLAFERGGMTASVYQQLAGGYAKRLQELDRRIDSLTNNNVNSYRYKVGVMPVQQIPYQIQEEVAQRNEEAFRKKIEGAALRAGRMRAFMDAAIEREGPFSVKAQLYAQGTYWGEWDAAADDPVRRMRLSLGLEGPRRELRELQRARLWEVWNRSAESFQRKREQTRENIERGYADSLLRAELSFRPDAPFLSPLQRIDAERAYLQRQIAAETDRYRAYSANAGMGEEARQASINLQRLNAELARLADREVTEKAALALKRLNEQFDSELLNYELSTSAATQGWEKTFWRMMIQGRQLSELKSRTDLDPEAQKDLEKALQEQIATAKHQLKLESQQYALDKKREAQERGRDIYEGVRQRIGGGILDMYYGGLNPEQFIRSLGDMLVEQAVMAQVTKFADPLIMTITEEIATINNLIIALDKNTAAQGGTAAFGGGGSASGKARKFGANQQIGAALGMYAVMRQGMDSGPSLGGALAGGLTGASLLGGPLGWTGGFALGAAVNLFGGLFGRKKKYEDPKNDLYPSFYHSPADFDYYAYRYRATGQLPAFSELQAIKRSEAPVVNVYIDNVKTRVRQEIVTQTNSAAAAQSNAYLDMHRPV